MNKTRVLTSDLSATAQVDPEERRQRLVVEALRGQLKRVAHGLRYLRLQAAGADDDADRRANLQLAAERLREHQVVTEQLHDARQCLVEYVALPADQRPQVQVRYMPPAKVTEFKVRAQALRKETDQAAIGVASAELDRFLIRWGTCGWAMHDPTLAFTTEPTQYRGKEYQLASWEVVDLIEATGWLGSLAQLVLEYNDLDTATLGKSLRPAGTRRGTSTAASAKNAQA